MTMWYDLGVAAVVVLAAWRGSKKGFVWQLATIAALVLAFGFAGPLSGRLAPMTGLRSPLDQWVSLAILYIVFSFGCFLLARGLRSAIEKVKFEDYDSHLGMLFGGVKGAVFCLVFTFFAVTLWPGSHPYILGSYSGYAAARFFDQIGPVVPAEYHRFLDGSLKQVGQCGLDDDSADASADPLAGGGAGGAPGRDHGHADHDHADDHAPGGDDPPGDHHHVLFDILLGFPKPDAERLHAEVDAALARVDDDDRRRMIGELEMASSATIEDLLQAWRGSGAVDPGADANAPLSEAEKTRRADLLFGIARVYSQHAAAQQSIVDEVAAQLAGVPPRVQLAVLADWSADLLTPAADPDPETSPVTPLDVRIERQLAAADVAVESLDQALRDRLGIRR